MSCDLTIHELKKIPKISFCALLAIASPTLLVAPSKAAVPAAEFSTTVIHRSAAEVAAAFARGDIGETLFATPAFKVNASRRESPGLAEIHIRDTDVFYVLSGSARFITGGRVVNARATTTDEIRGTAIEGGEARYLGAGDVVVVPAGVPHWFKEVGKPLLYFVVKPTTPAGH